MGRSRSALSGLNRQVAMSECPSSRAEHRLRCAALKTTCSVHGAHAGGVAKIMSARFDAWRWARCAGDVSVAFEASEESRFITQARRICPGYPHSCIGSSSPG